MVFSYLIPPSKKKKYSPPLRPFPHTTPARTPHEMQDPGAGTMRGCTPTFTHKEGGGLLLSPPPKYALYGPGFPSTVPGKPRKMPGFGSHPEVGYTGPFWKNTAYLPPDFNPQNGRFFISGILWPDQREIGHRRRDSGRFSRGRNPAVLRAYFGGKTVIWGHFSRRYGFPKGKVLPYQCVRL